MLLTGYAGISATLRDVIGAGPAAEGVAFDSRRIAGLEENLTQSESDQAVTEHLGAGGCASQPQARGRGRDGGRQGRFGNEIGQAVAALPPFALILGAA